MKPLVIFAILMLPCVALRAAVPEATIRIDPGEIVSRVTRHMTGACLEDVNHEVYGGLYSQMLFGESFQEPPALPPVKGFTAYGGPWAVRGGVVSVAADSGPKLIADRPAFARGAAGA